MEPDDNPVVAVLDTDAGWQSTALAAAHLIAWEWNGETRNVELAGDPRSLIDMPLGAANVDDLLARIHPDDREDVRRRWRKAIDNGAEFAADFRIVGTPQGLERWVAARGSIRSRSPHLRVCGVVEDISERKHNEREFVAQEQRYRRIVETAAEAICILDPDGRVVFANPAAAELTGYSEHDLIGRPIFESIFAQDLPTAESRFERRRAGIKDRYEIRVSRSDGRIIWVDVSSTPMLDDTGRFTGALLLATDITSRKTVEAEVARQREALERSNADLQQFAYVTSHDLQEPLRTINSYIGLLYKRYGNIFDEDAAEFLKFITGSAESMQYLIRDLLAYSRVVNPEAPPREPAGLDSVVQWAMMNLQHAIRESCAQVRFRDLPTVYCDRTELVQLFQNLLSNAIKYRGSEPPLIEISAEKLDSEWRIAVRDNGMGIAPQFHARVFELFKRLHGHDYPGTGLGLAICKRIVEKHEGRIWVESQPGAGSTFCFTLPE